MAKVRIDRGVEEQVRRSPGVTAEVVKCAESILEWSQELAVFEAYDSGAYHDSMRIQQSLDYDAHGVKPGEVRVVAGGPVSPRWAPYGREMRSDANHATWLEVGDDENFQARHIMRRAAQLGAASYGEGS